MSKWSGNADNKKRPFQGHSNDGCMVDCYYNCDMLRTINGYLALSEGLDDVNITPKSQYLHRVTYGLMQKYIRTHKEKKKLKKMFFKRLFHKKLDGSI